MLLFFDFFLLGAVLRFFYDFLRIFRRILRHGIVWVSMEDFFYWIVFSGAFFVKVCLKNDGVIRAFMVVAIVLGALCYDLLLGRYLVSSISRGVQKIKKRLKKHKEMTTMRLEEPKETRDMNGE